MNTIGTAKSTASCPSGIAEVPVDQGRCRFTASHAPVVPTRWWLLLPTAGEQRSLFRRIPTIAALGLLEGEGSRGERLAKRIVDLPDHVAQILV